MIISTIFAQNRPAANSTVDLYTVPEGSSARGTIWIAAETGYDFVSVQLVPYSILLSPVAEPTDGSDYILKTCNLNGNVPIYLQGVHLNQGDTIRIYSQNGDCAFTFNGELYT